MKNTNGCNEMIVRCFNIRKILQCLMVIMFPLVGGFFVCNNTFAYNISVSTTSGAGNISVSPSSDPTSGSMGTGTNISEDAITVTTTCRSGYNFSIGTSVNNNNLYLDGNSSNNTAGSYFTPSDGTTALNNAPNTWGYYYDSAVTPTAPTKSSVFSAVPALGSTPAVIKSTLPTPSGTDITDNFSIYYGVAVSSNLTPGAYKMIPDTNNNNANGTMVYYVTMAETCLPYTVHFSPVSTSGTGTGTMADQIIPRGEATALNSNAFTAPTGYEFDSWNTAQDGTGTSYTDGQSVTDIAAGNSTITLYAQWKKKTFNLVVTGDSNVTAMSVKKGSTTGTSTTCTKSSTTFTCASLEYGTHYYLYPTFASGYEFSSWTKTDSAAGSAISSTTTENAYYTVGNGAGALTLASKTSKLYMQDLTLANCPTTATTVYDNRDEKAYKVQKLNDGKCWMLDNLALDLTNSSVQSNLTADTTNATAQALSCLKTGKYNGTTCSSPYTAYAVSSSWTSSSQNYYDRPMINTASINVKPSNPPTSGVGSNLVGVYYNYCAATAGSYCYSSSSSSGNAQYDVCPKGWHLPTGNSSGDYGLLYSTSSYNYNTYDKFKNALSLPLSGYFFSGQAYDQGSYGYWWSSTRYGNFSMYYLNLDTSSVYTTDILNRRYGYSVRCVRSS